MTARSCPSCGVTFTQCTAAPGGDTQPRAGDIGICSTCGGLHVLQEDESFQEAREEHLLELDERTRRALATAQRLIRSGWGAARNLGEA